MAIVRPQTAPQAQPSSQQLPEALEPAGFMRDDAATRPQTATTSRQNLFSPTVNHTTPMIQMLSNVQVSQRAIRLTIPTTQLTHRAPRDIRRLEGRHREQEKEALRGRKEAKQDQRIAKREADQCRREEEVEQAYQKRQKFLKAQEE